MYQVVRYAFEMSRIIGFGANYFKDEKFDTLYYFDVIFWISTKYKYEIKFI